MDTRTFLDTVLPADGLRCCVAIKNKRTRQLFKSDNKSVTQLVHGISKGGADAYFACATYISDKSRKQDNVAFVQSLWLDIDVGEGKDYDSQKDAATALAGFCKTVDLPLPLIISSGRGIHAYFLLSEPVVREEWQPAADMLKAACAELGFRADPSRTADAASILRPVGTLNLKRPTVPVEVKRVGAYDLSREPLSAYINRLSRVVPETANGGLAPMPDFLKGETDNSDLTGGIQRPDVSAHKLADNCAIIGEVRDTKGNVEEPLWYNVLGVISKTIEAPDICHEWSKGHPDYSKGETNRKLTQLDGLTGTTMCATLEQHRPDACKGCPLHGENTSPVRLGFTEPPVEIEDKAPTGQLLKKTLTAPDGFKFEKRGNKWITLAVVGKEDDEVLWDVLTENVVTPVARIDNNEDGFDIRFETRFRDDQKTKQFSIPGSVIGGGGAELFKELGKHEIMIEAPMKPKFETYLRRWTTRQREDTDAVPSFNSLGWQDDGSFVLGNQKLAPGKPPEPVILSVPASNYGDDFYTKGDYTQWKNAVDRCYNTRGQEALQFMVLCGFAAPLMNLFNEFGGVTVFAYSEDSGHGKTSTQNTALSIWGKAMDLGGQDGQSTYNAMWQKVGGLSNLPYVVDELTNKKAEDSSKLVYTISGGVDRARLDVTGALRKSPPRWSTIMLASGNVSLSERIALHRANVRAELARLFEFYLPPITGLSKNEADEALPQITENHGWAGLEFAQYIVDNREDVTKALMTVRKQVQSRYNMDHKERFWSALISCVVLALTITRKLSIVQFQPAFLLEWIGHTLTANRTGSIQVLRGSDEIMADLLNHNVDSMLITEGQGDAKTNTFARVIRAPRVEIKGRVIIGPPGAVERDTMYIPATVIREWCALPGVTVSPKRLAADGRSGGWLLDTNKRFRLGQGTQDFGVISGQVRCWVIDPHKFAASSGVLPQAVKKVALVEDA